MRPASPDEFAIAIICARSLEADAVERVFDETYDKLSQLYAKRPGDCNAYINGRIGNHNVVLCYLLGMREGNAASVASGLKISYKGVRLALVVGICGGFPYSPTGEQIFLGDVIINSQSSGGEFQHQMDTKHTLNRPSQEVRSLLEGFKAIRNREELQARMLQHLHTMQGSEARWCRPHMMDDIFFNTSYRHKHYSPTSSSQCRCFTNSSPDEICTEALQTTCSRLGCDEKQIRRRRYHTDKIDPAVHVGTITSTHTVMKSGEQRERLVKSDNALGFTAKRVGVWDNISCVLIHAVSDYADGHENKAWQAYAAATAASGAKSFLEYWRPVQKEEDAPPKSQHHFVVPFARNPQFAGREKEVAGIEQMITQQNGPSKIALLGIPGIGKSQLALETAYHMRQTYNFSVFWITCTSCASVKQSYLELAQSLEIDIFEPGEARDKVNSHLSQKSVGKWLLIFDDIEDMDMLIRTSTDATAPEYFLPQSEQGHILFTTRSRWIAMQQASSHTINLSAPNTEEALTILKSSLMDMSLLDDIGKATELLEHLGFYPLAIAQAAAFINENCIGLSDYTTLLQKHEPDLIELLSEDFRDLGQHKGIKSPIATTWLTSFQLIRKLNQTAVDLLLFMACISPRDIPQNLLPQTASAKAKVDAIAVLEAFSFVSQRAGGYLLDMHQLVYRETRKWMKTNKLLGRQILRAADHLSKVFPDATPENLEMWREYLPHVLIIIGESEFRKNQTLYPGFISKVARCLYYDERYDEAEELSIRLIEHEERMTRPDHPDMLSNIAHLAAIYRDKGRWKEAEELALQVLESRKQALGPESPDTLSSMANLTAIYRDQGRWKEAEELALQVLESRKRVLESRKRVLESRKRVLGSEHPDTLNSMVNLTAIYRDQGRWKEAEELALQVLESRTRILGPEHPDTLTIMDSLASIYRHVGRLKDTKELLTDVVEVRKRVLGLHHPDTQATADKLASISDNQDLSGQRTQVELSKSNPSGEYPKSSVGSLPQSSLFDQDNKSRGTFPSTMDTSLPRSKAELRPPSVASPPSPYQAEIDREDSDTETICSADSGADDQRLSYIQTFADQLNRDIRNAPDHSTISQIPTPYFESIFKTFAWRLHGESSNPFQWGAAVTLRQKKKELMDLLFSGSPDGEDEESVSDNMEEKEHSQRSLVTEPPDIRAWINDIQPQVPSSQNVDATCHTIEDQVLPLLPDYENFISQSDAYQWLLSKVLQQGQFELRDPNLISHIGMKIGNRLRTQESLRKISRRRSSLVKMTFHLGWDPVPYFHDQGIAPATPDILEKTLCLTGTWNEAQAATVAEFLRQTWPVTAEHTISFMQKLIVLPAGQDIIYQSSAVQIRAHIQLSSSCSISATGSSYLVSEIAEQIGWLASTLRAPPISQGLVACTPCVEDITIISDTQTAPLIAVEGRCHLRFDFEEAPEPHGALRGFCWAPLFHKAILISGYPITRRPEAKTGLELSLGTMAHLIQSRQIIQWDDRLILKGFSSLLVATLATAGMVVWHLVLNTNSEERISYIDPRLDTLNIRVSENLSLRCLEGSRHIVGWCSSAIEFCGHAKAKKDISASGLSNLPASIVIDKLYIEAGSTAVGGLSMNINKKPQPTWLTRGSNYPQRIEWMSLQTVVFYDVSERRAWLVDGVSALLHLVRISLHRHEHSEYSTYNWLFDPEKLNDTWENCTGYFAAKKTLTDWDNLDLKLYVKGRKGDKDEFSTFGEEVERILHSFDLIIDMQTKTASQDGLRIRQTIDQRKGIVGFDILDVIDPFGPIHMRSKSLDFGRHGWADLIPAIGTITIFGNGFGDLIRPNDSQPLCDQWKSVPIGKDYMATSVTTIKILYEKRLRRLQPNLGIGQMTSGIVLAAGSQSSQPCECLGHSQMERPRHSKLAHFLVSKRFLEQKGLSPVDIATLEEKAAVVFGHFSILNLKGLKKAQAPHVSKEYEEAETPGPSNSSQSTNNPSAVSSDETQSTRSTEITQPSLNLSTEAEIQEDTPSKGRWKGKQRQWVDKLKIWRKNGG